MDFKEIKKPADSSKSTSLSQYQIAFYFFHLLSHLVLRFKQGEQKCEVLQATAVGLRAEWSKLKDEMHNLLMKCERVKDENKSIMEELTKIYGRDAISDLVAMESDAISESDNEETTPTE
ncbi:unnamed protein product [Dovyalis caffra]|uniref:Uncharacterized protein n=1 Tax=Dovyalis caffra TaxID=77055 RepID=A0AAV1R9V6_9ROSI|nr:unnamed protein product [Dovyalis caffra]